MLRNITRRHFAKQTVSIGAGLAVPQLFSCAKTTKNKSDDLEVEIPLPIQIVIDDVGWWSGEDGNAHQQPYRTGISRDHVPADYQAIVDLGKKLGVRPQAATILCEWDRENILKNLPTSTWMGKNWDNSKWVGPWLDEAAEIITNNHKHYELTLHGVGHEYWDGENFTRAEWADNTGRMRPLEQVELHLDYFEKLLDQNQLGSFPSSFVPTAFLHGFGKTGDHMFSMAEVIKKKGINYINTPFNNMYNTEGVQFEVFGIDSEVITVDRGEDVLNWNTFGQGPKGIIAGPTCGLHWPNLLHLDSDRNSEIVDLWVAFLEPYKNKLDRILSINSEEFRKQLVHHVGSRASFEKGVITLELIDDQLVPKELANGRFQLKIDSLNQLDFKPQRINLISHEFEKIRNKFRYTLILEPHLKTKSAIIEYNSATS